jgi:hypothetical protein
MEAAVKEILEGKLKLRVAARAYNLPLGSLRRRAKGIVKSFTHCSGKKALLSPRDESALAKHIIIWLAADFH